jgi:hypothetical protein
MKCLTTDDIYLFLEGKLPESKEKIEQHMALCPKCRLAVRNREQVVRAAETLPQMKAPEGFARQIIAFLFPPKARLRDSLTAVAAGFASFVFIIFAYLAFTGKTLAGFFLILSRTMLEAIQTVSLMAVKTYKLFAVSVRVVRQILSLAFSELNRLTSLISLEAQIILVAISLLGFLSLFFLFRKYVWTGEKA